MKIDVDCNLREHTPAGEAQYYAAASATRAAMLTREVLPHAVNGSEDGSASAAARVEEMEATQRDTCRQELLAAATRETWSSQHWSLHVTRKLCPP